jgi:hypothetical protein
MYTPETTASAPLLSLNYDDPELYNYGCDTWTVPAIEDIIECDELLQYLVSVENTVAIEETKLVPIQQYHDTIQPVTTVTKKPSRTTQQRKQRLPDHTTITTSVKTSTTVDKEWYFKQYGETNKRMLVQSENNKRKKRRIYDDMTTVLSFV